MISYITVWGLIGLNLYIMEHMKIYGILAILYPHTGESDVIKGSIEIYR